MTDNRSIKDVLTFSGKKEELQKEIDLIDSAMVKSSAPEDIIVNRRTTFGNLRGMFGGITAKELASLLRDPEKAIGSTLNFDGFCSTSVVPGTNSTFGSTNLHILIPKGSKGMYVESLSRSPKETEFLLSRGIKI